MTEQGGSGPDAAALWLAQLPGMTPDLLRRLIAAFGSPAATVRASSGALRGLGLAPTQVARIVAGAREVPQVAAGLKGLQRLGILPLPYGTPVYPQRLLDLPSPPLVLYAQGQWPLAQPLVALTWPDALDPPLAEPWAALVAELGPHVGFATLTSAAALGMPPRLLGVPFGLMLARQRLTAPLLKDVAAGRTTLLSLAPPTAPPATAAALAALPVLQAVLALLAEAALALAPLPEHDALLEAARAHGKRVFVFGLPPRVPPPSGMRRLRPGKPGAQALRAALGLNLAGADAVQQERLF